MSAVTNIWRQLVQRRLWPVAIILIAALVAVPLTLAKDPEPQPAVPPAEVDTKSELAITPVVALASSADRAKRRRVLGTGKNPFAVSKPSRAATAGPSTSGPTQSSDTGAPPPADPSMPTGTAPSSGGGPITGGGIAPPPASEPAPAPKRYSKHELTVRFGIDDSMRRMSIERLDAVPVGEEPLVVYLGVADRGKSAVFLIDSSINAQGDGECMPDPNTCEKIHLREGETEFFDIVGENGETVAAYQLDLLKIHEGRDGSARTASRAVRRVLREAAVGALQYDQDPETGVLTPAATGVARTVDAGIGVPQLP